MSRWRLLLLTLLALCAFAGNSLLCRAALRDTGIDAGSFTAVRLLAGALMLALLVRLRAAPSDRAGLRWDLPAALALFAYAAAFSYAYRSLSAATGALLLFGAVQLTMIGRGLAGGERLAPRQWAGLGLACAGLLGLLLPGLAAPPLAGALLMLAAGVAWGVYTLRGRHGGDPLRRTASNFALAAPLGLALALMDTPAVAPDPTGIALAVASGALASGLGYAVWYAVLPALGASTAAIVQLNVPVIAAFGGLLLLGEAMSLRAVAASAAVLAGIGLATLQGLRLPGRRFSAGRR